MQLNKENIMVGLLAIGATAVVVAVPIIAAIALAKAVGKRTPDMYDELDDDEELMNGC